MQHSVMQEGLKYCVILCNSRGRRLKQSSDFSAFSVIVCTRLTILLMVHERYNIPLPRSFISVGLILCCNDNPPHAKVWIFN